MRTLLCVVLLTMACGHKRDGAADFLEEGARKDLPTIKQQIADGKAKDAIFECAANLANVAKLEDEALAKDLHDTCEHDVPLARVKAATELAEAARKAKPDAEVLSDCFSAEYEGGLDDLVKAKREDGASKALVARFHAACPKSK